MGFVVQCGADRDRLCVMQVFACVVQELVLIQIACVCV